MENIFRVFKLCLIIVSGAMSLALYQGCQSNDDLDRISVSPQEQPTVNSIQPTSGPVGTEVTISGTNFRSDMDQNVVSFNGAEAELISADPTTLVVEVPSSATTGIIEVAVLNYSTGGPVFTVEAPAPIISSFDPLSGSANVEVTITGENFSETPSENTVTFNGTEAVVRASTSTSITAIIPEGAKTGPISVTVKGKTATSLVDFIIVEFSTITIPIASGDDDVEELVVLDPEGSGVVGQMDIGSSDLELGEFSGGDGLQDVGIRFIGVAIPAGATVTEAYIQFNCDNTGADPVEMTIYGENVGDAAAYVDEAFNLTSRPTTSSSVVWSIPEWVSSGDRLPAQQTVNLAPIIQEILNRTDWTSGNSINFILKNTGVSATASSSSGGREAEDYSSSKPQDGAELTVTFQ